MILPEGPWDFLSVGEHRVAAQGGAIVAKSTDWITETAGPVHFALAVAGNSIVDARVGTRGTSSALAPL